MCAQCCSCLQNEGFGLRNFCETVQHAKIMDDSVEVSGYSASYHIQQRLVQEAKRLAVYNNASLKMVAYTLGFDDLSHFSRFFKHAAGINFSEYKKTTCAREAD
jgi:AraC-like DNA-binding protein